MLLTGCSGAEDDNDSGRGSFAADVDDWLNAVCDDQEPLSDQDLFDGDVGSAEPESIRSCDDDPSYVHATAYLFNRDPRSHLAGSDEEGSTFYCWTKQVEEGWAAVVFEDYEIDDDPLAGLEEFGFSEC